jgi:hypothetical protein
MLEGGGIAPRILDLCTGGDLWPAPCSNHFNPGEMGPEFPAGE